MNVYEGPRREVRRILHEGRPVWVQPADDLLLLPDGRTTQEATATYLPPVTPATIICVHMNFDSRRREFRLPDIEQPTYFMKPVTTLNAHRGSIVRPEGTSLLNYEGELAIVIGRPTRNVRPDEVSDHLAGFAAVNDVGLHDFRDTDSGSMLRVKGHDGFCPIGPGIVAGVDPRSSRLRSYRNGVVVQDDTLDNLLFDIDYLVADLSRHITLNPGDLILAGTPAGSRPLDIGDTIDIDITDIGRLSSTVITGPLPAAAVGYQPAATEIARLVAYAGTSQ
jgi:5-oxopent-3-ene-1,2,5-tricarboxylate decarboxylase/2-hydroxyhepta-2,4-diene-1,7-dioate isomerase